LQVLSLPLDGDHGAEEIWTRVAGQCRAWLDEQGLAVRDAVVLLPFAQQLAPARRAFGRLGGWQPRLETTHSLAAAFGPNTLAQAGQISLDPAVDALTAQALLDGQSWAQDLRRRDERAFRVGVGRLVELAHALLRAAGQRSPRHRDAFWVQARGVMSAATGPGGVERALALVALEWAASDGRQPPTDALFALSPSAWIVVQAGGPDALADALLCGTAVPALKIVADVDLDRAHALGAIEESCCSDFEDLAQRSASAVLQHLAAGRAPVALVAQDRVLVRRVRALLERRGLPMQDETGWTLATTPPAAQLMALLRAASGRASLDDLLAWLKTGLARELRERAGDAGLAQLEACFRTRGWRRPQSVREAELKPEAARLWTAARELLARLQRGPARRPLLEWIESLRDLLRASGGETALREMDAGEELLDALWLSRSPWPGSAHAHTLQGTALREHEFLAWIDESLEAQQFVPASAEAAQLIITPMARAMLRPFKAVVLPGADAAGLSLSAKQPALLSDTQAQAIGLPSLEQQRAAMAFAFAQLLRAPALTLLRRTALGSEPLPPSPLLQRLSMSLLRAGQPHISGWQDQRPLREIEPLETGMAQADTAGMLPARLSASSVEALRNCPYQFFGRVMLGLREPQELETEIDKREYGNWLHSVLHRFHTARQEGTACDDASLLREAAAAEPAPSAEEFLPFAAGFDSFAQRYLDWLAKTEAQGQRYLMGEAALSVEPFGELGGLKLEGRLDRVDEAQQGPVLIDYKTGSAQGLEERVAEPLEDTQLAVYAVLRPAHKAGYLALDDKDGITFIEHKDVNESAAALVVGLGEDLKAMRDGASLPALGEGSACDFCTMRGLCRKDDWT